MTSRIPIAAAAAALIPVVSLTSPSGGAVAQETHELTFQAAWPSASSLWDSFVLFTERVEAMSGGRLQIEPLPAGAVVPPFELLEAVSAGVLDGAHWAAAYNVGKNKAATLFGPAPGGPFGMQLTDYLGWIHHGGGLELYRELFREHIGRDAVPLPLAAVDNQVLGWFNQEVNSWEDLAGLKCRQTGITAEVFSASGMATVNLPGGEILPAAERGVIDCAEWVGPGEDIRMGFHEVFEYYYMPSVHEPAIALELIVNPEVWDSLSPDLQEIMRVASFAVTVESQIKNNIAHAKALDELQTEHGVKIMRTPDDILIKALESWDAIAEREAEQNPFFREVMESQRDWAEQIVRAKQTVNPPPDLLYNYYWK